MSARDFCVAHGFAASSFYLWSSRLRNGEQRVVDVKLARVVREPVVQRSAEIIVERGALRVRLAEHVEVDVLERVLLTLSRTQE